MFVYRVAGPSRLALPVKLAHKRSKKTIFLTNGGFGCLFVVQRHMSRTSRNSTLGMRNPQDVRSENKDMGDVEEIKRQARLIAKNGKRGQETKPIDAQVFPTLDVELIESHKYPRQLYFPYMPRRLRDWPIFARFSPEDIVFAFITPLALVWKLITERQLPNWDLFKRDYWRKKKDRTRQDFLAISSASRALSKNQKAKTSAEAPPTSALGTSLGAGTGLSKQDSPKTMRELRLNIWKSAVGYTQEAEKYGREARSYYMKRLDNDRRNWNAMSLIASKNLSPYFVFPYYQVATRNWTDGRWWTLKDREQRLWENIHFKDLSSPHSPLYPILESVKQAYGEMNQAVVDGRMSDLGKYAAKRYLNEVEKRAVTIRRERETKHRTWNFEHWVKEPECVSIRAKDFFADYPGAYKGDHLLLNLLIRFDSWQSLETIERPGGRLGNRPPSKTIERRRVIEYLVADFRTWMWEGKPRFIQEIYPGQKLDIVSYEMSEKQFMARMKKQIKKEEAENSDGQRLLPSPSLR